MMESPLGVSKGPTGNSLLRAVLPLWNMLHFYGSIWILLTLWLETIANIFPQSPEPQIGPRKGAAVQKHPDQIMVA